MSFNETQKELSNYILQSSEEDGMNVAKIAHTLKLDDTKLGKPSTIDTTLTGLEKDTWLENW